jgi:N6-adenosine-specific RNA methylase IME4
MTQGYWTRANPEACWLATRGAPKRLHADVRQLIVAPIMEHSRKPDEAYERIERLVEGPYLELYARRPRPGWTSWGNELAFELPPHDPETGEIIEPEPEVLDLPEFLTPRDRATETEGA